MSKRIISKVGVLGGALTTTSNTITTNTITTTTTTTLSIISKFKTNLMGSSLTLCMCMDFLMFLLNLYGIYVFN